MRAVRQFASEWGHRARLEFAERRRVAEQALQERSSKWEFERRMAIPRGTLATGEITRRTPVRSALLGLRLGSAHLVARHVESGSRFYVRHKWLPRQQLAWSTTDDLPLPGVQSAVPEPFDLSAELEGIPIQIDRMSTTFAGVTFDHGWMTMPRAGGCDGVRVGLPGPQRTWHTWLLGLGAGARPFVVDDVEVELRTVTTGKGQRDQPCLVEGVMTSASAMLDTDAQEFLDASLTWLLELYAGCEVVPAGVWAGDGRGGRLTDYGRDLLGPRRRIVSSTVPLDRYLRDTAPAWTALSPEDRQAVRIGVSSRKATQGAPLEISIMVSAMTLELFANQWLTDDEKDFGLPSRAVRKLLLAALRDATAQHAPGSEFDARLKDVIPNYLFTRPASGRFERLLSRFGIAFDGDQLSNFVKRRNETAHPAAGATEREARIRAMMFGHHMVGRCLLARLGYSGGVYNEATREIVLAEPTTTTLNDG